MTAKLKVGKIVGTHGLAGYLRVYPYVSDLEDFKFYRELIIANQKLEISNVKYKKNIVLLKFKAYNHINELNHLLGKELFVDKTVAENLLDEDEYLLEDLLGLEVVDQSGQILGKVIDTRQTTSQTTLLVNGEKGEWFLPFVDAFIIEVDLKQGIIVQLIEGLIDEN